jgi:flavin-dependent dehydrogenase
VRERILVIGDAAGQVKPTTGGGIYLGNLGAQIACDVLKEALDKDNLSENYLARYHKRWKAKMGREISFGRWIRWVYSKLSDQQIETLFNTFASGDMATALLNSPDFSFDWHSKLFLSGLQYTITYPIQKISHLLSREKND